MTVMNKETKWIAFPSELEEVVLGKARDAAHLEMKGILDDKQDAQVIKILKAFEAIRTVLNAADREFSSVHEKEGVMTHKCHIDERHVVCSALIGVILFTPIDTIHPYSDSGGAFDSLVSACIAMHSFADFSYIIQDDFPQFGVGLSSDILSAIKQRANNDD